MKRFISGIRKFWGDDQGLETVEYAIAAGLITLAVIAAISLLGTNIATKLTDVAHQVAGQ